MKIQTSMRIDEEIFKKIKELADKNERSQNFILEEVIKLGLKKYVGEKK